MISHKKIQVFGRVQGVFYRANAAKKARELELKGYVMNLDDGSVQAEVEGPPEQIEKFIEWCKSGPPAAKVERVISEEENLKHFSDFRIRN